MEVVADPFGRPPWPSPPLPGALHDVRPAREHRVIDALSGARIVCWADTGYQGTGGTVRVPHPGRWETLSADQQAVNRSRAKILALVEQAVTTLKSGGFTVDSDSSTSRITSFVQAVRSSIRRLSH